MIQALESLWYYKYNWSRLVLLLVSQRVQYRMSFGTSNNVGKDIKTDIIVFIVFDVTLTDYFQSVC